MPTIGYSHSPFPIVTGLPQLAGNDWMPRIKELPAPAPKPRVAYSRSAEAVQIEQPESILRTPHSVHRPIGLALSHSASPRSVHEPFVSQPRTGVQVILDKYEAELNQATQL